MYGETQSSIGYKGIVTICKQYKNNIINKKTFNTGEPALFKAICKALAGYSIADNCPSYVKIGIVRSGNSEPSSILSVRTNVALTNGSYSNELDDKGNSVNHKVSFSFSLVKDDLILDDEDGDTLVEISMHSRNGDKLATVHTTVKDLQIEPQMSLVIKWDMFVSNKDEVEREG